MEIYLEHSHHGLRTPDEAFFHCNPDLFGLGQTNWADKFWGIWGIFDRTISTHFCPCFPLFNHHFYKKLSVYIHIPNIYLGLGLEFEFEFGPQMQNVIYMQTL